VCDQFVNSLNGLIGSGNYTYYKLTHRGYIRLILESPRGDADLYISSLTQSPTFENYELQSTTCGEDIVDILPDMNRPVTVGVYGHTYFLETRYILHLFVVTDYDRGYPEEITTYSVPPSQKKTVNKHSQKSFGASAKDEEESVIWTILVGILKILFDVLM
jgi:hypothetical protein